MKEGFLQVPTSDGTMRTFFAYPEEQGPFPVVVFYMDFWGLREELFDLARQLAVHGYYCVVPDLYYRQGIILNQVHDESGTMVSLIKLDAATKARVLAPLDKLSDAEAVSDTGFLLDFLKNVPAAKPGAKGCVGFCLGGRLAIRAASHYPEFRATASLHGSSLMSDNEDSPHLLAAKIEGELYCGFAEHDPFAPPQTVAAFVDIMKSGKAVAYRYEVHKGAEHGYALPHRDIYDKRAALRDWELIVAMFKRQLAVPAPSKIAFSRLAAAEWKKGLRGFLDYRDLGVAAATEGRFGATVGRARHAFKRSIDAPLHYHSIGFHFMYVLRGSTRTYMDGLGDVVMHAGDCVTYQGEIPQAHTEYSEDYEVLQVTLPAEYPTIDIERKAK